MMWHCYFVSVHPTHLRRHTAGRCRLAHASLPPNENPLQALLVHEVLEGGVQVTEVCHLPLPRKKSSRDLLSEHSYLYSSSSFCPLRLDCAVYCLSIVDRFRTSPVLFSRLCTLCCLCCCARTRCVWPTLVRALLRGLCTFAGGSENATNTFGRCTEPLGTCSVSLHPVWCVACCACVPSHHAQIVPGLWGRSAMVLLSSISRRGVPAVGVAAAASASACAGARRPSSSVTAAAARLLVRQLKQTRDDHQATATLSRQRRKLCECNIVILLPSINICT